MKTHTLPHSNAMPAPTWHRLHMNETTVELPADATPARSIVVEASENILGEAGAFDAAVENLQFAVYGQAIAENARVDDSALNSLDQLALSAFQSDLLTLEAQRSVSGAFTTGMGSEVFAYLRAAAGSTVVIATAPNQRGAQASVRIPGIEGSVNAAAIDVVAAEGSELTLHVTLDSPEPGRGVVGSSLRVFAGRDARVTITSTQTLDDSWIALDDTGMVLDDRARVEVSHTVLGAKQAFVGLAGDLRGEAAKTAIATRYLGHGDQKLDLNYALHHRGPKTESVMKANGVLAGQSQKTLRGTINFIRGCKESSGQETETVLLADERTINRSIPTILCGEDDVAGNHGATIGHVRPEQLLYLASRGLSPEAAEQLFIRATFEEATLNASDSETRAGVVRLGTTLLKDFEEVIA